MPESLVEVSWIFLVKNCDIKDTKKQKQQQHTNATENNTYGKTEFSGRYKVAEDQVIFGFWFWLLKRVCVCVCLYVLNIWGGKMIFFLQFIILQKLGEDDKSKR